MAWFFLARARLGSKIWFEILARARLGSKIFGSIWLEPRKFWLVNITNFNLHTHKHKILSFKACRKIYSYGFFCLIPKEPKKLLVSLSPTIFFSEIVSPLSYEFFFSKSIVKNVRTDISVPTATLTFHHTWWPACPQRRQQCHQTQEHQGALTDEQTCVCVRVCECWHI